MPTEEALWGTQGGGLAKWDEASQQYIFVEFPDWWTNHDDVVVPPEWGVIPANEVARQEMIRAEYEGLFY